MNLSSLIFHLSLSPLLSLSPQVRQKRTASVMSTSSASSYISDSGLGESYIPSSGGGSGPQPRVTAYVQNQHRVTSQLSDREHMAHLAATMLINNSTHQEDLNPNGRRGHYRNFPGAYSSDDSSSCFTTTSLSSNSEFFVPRRPTHMYTDSDDSRHHARYSIIGVSRCDNCVDQSLLSLPLDILLE